MTTGVSVTPALGGPVTLDLAPLGQVEIAPTYAPIRLRAEVADLDPPRSATSSPGARSGARPGSTLPGPRSAAIVTYVGVAALGAAWSPASDAAAGDTGVAGACIPFLALSACAWIGLFT